MIIKYEHLLGKQWVHGTQDCYTIAQQIFKDNLGIELTNYARPTDWWIQGLNLYAENFRKEGFEVVDCKEDDIQLLDVFMICIPDGRCLRNVINHCAIYVGDGKVVHHLGKRLSECTLYRGYLKRYTSYIIRHKEGPKIRDPKMVTTGTQDLMSLILPHKRRELEDAST